MLSGSIGITQDGFRFAPVAGRFAWTTFISAWTSKIARLMSVVIREHHDPSQLPVDQTAFADAAVQQNELLAVAAPVDGLQRTAAVRRFLLQHQFASRIEQRDDSRIPPKVDRHVLQPRKFHPKLPDGGRLRVANQHLSSDDPTMIDDNHAVVAAAIKGPLRFAGVVREIADIHRIGVLVQVRVVAPKLLSRAVPHRVADGQPVAA